VIAATNKDLKQEISQGKFRDDLYFRLNVVPVYSPPLRDKKEDIPLLLEHFAAEAAESLGRKKPNLSPDLTVRAANSMRGMGPVMAPHPTAQTNTKGDQMITFHQLEWCPDCHRVRQVMTELELTYTTVNVAADKDLVSAMNNIQSQSTSNPVSFCDKASIEALNGPQDFQKAWVAEFDRRRRFIVDRLNKMPGVSCLLPQGRLRLPNFSGCYGKKRRPGR
jgi:glutaredoxin